MARIHAERDAEIYAKRKAGKLLRELAEEYGLTKESIRRIECQEWRREQNPDRVPERLKNTMLNVIADATRSDGYNADGNYEYDDRYHAFRAAIDNDPKRAAELIAAFGCKPFEGVEGIGKQTLAAIEAWLAKHGYHW